MSARTNWVPQSLTSPADQQKVKEWFLKMWAVISSWFTSLTVNPTNPSNQERENIITALSPTTQKQSAWGGTIICWTGSLLCAESHHAPLLLNSTVSREPEQDSGGGVYVSMDMDVNSWAAFPDSPHLVLLKRLNLTYIILYSSHFPCSDILLCIWFSFFFLLHFLQ